MKLEIEVTKDKNGTELIEFVGKSFITKRLKVYNIQYIIDLL